MEPEEVSRDAFSGTHHEYQSLDSKQAATLITEMSEY